MRLAVFFLFIYYYKVENLRFFKSNYTYLYWIIGFLFIIVTSVPYIYGYIYQGSDYIFLSRSTTSKFDTYTYLAWIEQVKQGHLLLTGLYSNEVVSYSFFHPLFIIFGLLGRFLDLTSDIIYHIMRILGGVFFILILKRFIGLFFEENRKRLIVFSAVLFSSGAGYIFGPLSVDIWMSEWSIFMHTYQTVLNSYSMGLILYIFYSFLKVKRTDNNAFSLSNSIPTVIASNLLTLIHPYYIVLVIAVVFFWVCLQYKYKKKIIAFFLLFCITSSPALLIQLTTLNSNTVLGIWAFIQSNVPSYSYLYYIYGFGISLLFAFIGAVILLKKISVQGITNEKSRFNLLFIWLIVFILLVFNPFFISYERKYAEGIIIPVIILGSVGYFWLFEGNNLFKSKLNKILIHVSLFILLVGTNISIFVHDVRIYSNKESLYYITKKEYEAVTFLKNNAQESEIVLTGSNFGNIIPGITGRTVYNGHYDQTVNFKNKLTLTYRLLSQPVIQQTIISKFLSNNNIRYIVIDKELRNNLDLSIKQYKFLSLIYDNGDIQIYKY